jgi:hypothetical protein
MNLQEAAKHIESPQGFTQQTSEELKDLLEKYPFAQVFSILYLKSLSDLQSFHYDDALKKHACSITNRAILYNLIHEKNAQQSAVQTLENIEKTQATTHILQENEETKILPILEENQESTAIQDEQLPNNTDKIVLEFDLQEIHNAMEAQSANVLENKDEEPTTKEVEQVFDIRLSDVPELDINIASSAINSNLEWNMGDFIPHHQTKNHSPEKEKRSFIAWLQSAKNKSDENPSLDENKKEKINNLIENFIENQPKISKPKSDFYSANKKAMESIQENEIPVSSTLAKIYALQGHYPKSIAIYQQLILKYPEKKTYFANQINEIEKKLNS